jgi:hypothetical protein
MKFPTAFFPMNEHSASAPVTFLALIPDSRDMRRKLKLGKSTPPLGGKKSMVSYAGKKFGSG